MRRIGRTPFIVAIVALAAPLLLMSVPAGAGTYYDDPDWAPDWFKTCTGYKQWSEWTFEFDQGPGEVFVPANDGTNWDWRDSGSLSSPMLDLPNHRETPGIALTDHAAWLGSAEGRQGVIGGVSPYDLHIWMDNEAAPLVKQVWIQLDVWTAGDNWAAVEDGLSLSYDGESGVVPELAELGDPDAGGWRTLTAYWEMPQLEWEQVDFVFNVEDEPIYVDTVRMATQCTVPEPFTMVTAFLAIGSFGMYMRKHTRNAQKCSKALS